MAAKHACICALIAAGLAGCLTVPYDRGQPHPAQFQAPVRQALDQQYPPAFRAVHRAILTLRGRQTDLMGYLLVDRQGKARLAAASAMGGTAFEVIVDGANVYIPKNPAGMRKGWLLNGPAHDLAAIYLMKPPPDASVVVHGENELGLVAEDNDGTLREFLFDTATNRPKGYREVRRNRIAYELSISDESPVAGASAPRTITIKNHAMHYALAIKVVSLDPAELTADLFQTDQPPCSKK